LRLLQSNWEPSYIGGRIEIKGNNILFLWRSAPVLKTVFSLKQDGNKTQLILKENELKYSYDNKPYAYVVDLYYQNKVLYITNDFPISGKSVDEYRPTDNTRYGSFIVDNSKLKELEGKWVSDGMLNFVIKKDKLIYNDKTIKICLLKSFDINVDVLKIADVDPAKESAIQGLLPLRYINGSISTGIMVCDAPTVYITLRKDNNA